MFAHNIVRRRVHHGHNLVLAEKGLKEVGWGGGGGRPTDSSLKANIRVRIFASNVICMLNDLFQIGSILDPECMCQPSLATYFRPGQDQPLCIANEPSLDIHVLNTCTIYYIYISARSNNHLVIWLDTLSITPTATDRADGIVNVWIWIVWLKKKKKKPISTRPCICLYRPSFNTRLILGSRLDPSRHGGCRGTSWHYLRSLSVQIYQSQVSLRCVRRYGELKLRESEIEKQTIRARRTTVMVEANTRKNCANVLEDGRLRQFYAIFSWCKWFFLFIVFLLPRFVWFTKIVSFFFVRLGHGSQKLMYV